MFLLEIGKRCLDPLPRWCVNEQVGALLFSHRCVVHSELSSGVDELRHLTDAGDIDSAVAGDLGPRQASADERKLDCVVLEDLL